jgi:hypothetical protein
MRRFCALNGTATQRIIDGLTKKYPLIGKQTLEIPEREPISDGRRAPDFARSIPYWFLAIVGLVYASGFLIVMVHLGSYGVRDVGGELWKARDIHIGVLGFVFPATIIGTTAYTALAPVIRLLTPPVRSVIWKILSLQNRHAASLWYIGGLHPAEDQWWLVDLRRLTNGLLIIPLELGFYSLAMFHKDSASDEPYGVLALMLIITVFLPRACSLLEECGRWLSKPLGSPRLGFVFALRFSIAAVVIRLSWEAGNGYWSIVALTTRS